MRIQQEPTLFLILCKAVIRYVPASVALLVGAITIMRVSGVIKW